MTLEDLLPRRTFLTAALATLALPAFAQGTYPVDNDYALSAKAGGPRSRTDYIILHTMEGDLSGIGRIKRKKLANYVVARSGVVYPVVHRDREANHAGKSRWHGRDNISDVSVGIEFEGSHDVPLTAAQYRSGSALVNYLQKIYRVPESNVLGHYQVAANTNRWSRGKLLRGRRHDGINIDWQRMGIARHNTNDVDYLNGSVSYDPVFADLVGKRRDAAVKQARGERTPEPTQIAKAVLGRDMVITSGKTAYSVVGDVFDEENTIYAFPNKDLKAGDEIRNGEWDAIPVGTKVYVGRTKDEVTRITQPIITLKSGESLWSKIRGAYDDPTTRYISPKGELFAPTAASLAAVGKDWKIILGVERQVELNGTSMTPSRAAGAKYNTAETIYCFPDGTFKDGTQIKDFSALPTHTTALVRRI